MAGSDKNDKNIFLKIGEWLQDATIGAAMAESPAVMTAAGWKKENGKWVQKPSEGSKKLSDNLAILSTFSPTHPVNVFIERVVPWVFKSGVYALGRANTPIRDLVRAALISRTISRGSPDNLNNYFSGLSLNSTKASNMREAIILALRGKRDAEQFINNPVVLGSILHNKDLIKRLLFPSNYNVKQKSTANSRILTREEFNRVINPNNTNSPNLNVNNIGGIYNKLSDEVILPININESIPFHEYLHSLGYGNSPFLKWKASFLFDKNKNIPKYFLDPEETAVHSVQYGRAIGLKEGQPYPGDEAFDLLLSEKGISGAPFYFKRDTPKARRRFWDAITGKYFTIPIGIGAGTTLLTRGND